MHDPMAAEPPTVLLVHGLGATRGVWAGLIEALDWPGPVIAPDLPGHGAAAWSGDYSLGSLAAAVSADQEIDGDVIVVGHSLGGAVGLCLASGFFRPMIRAAIGIGVKVGWTAEDVAGMAKVAAKGIRWFETRAEAEQRFLLQSGLGTLGQDHPAVAAATVDAVASGPEGWRVAQDPATFAQNALNTAGLMAAAACPVVLGAGTDDQMVTEADLAAFTASPRMAEGRGHNVHVEDPDWVAALIRETAEAR